MLVYEAVTLSAFLLLLIEYVAATATEHKPENAIARKDKRSLPIPFCCWRYRPTKPYFMYTVKVSERGFQCLAERLTSGSGRFCNTSSFVRWDP
jgi:hypothetical protein